MGALARGWYASYFFAEEPVKKDLVGKKQESEGGNQISVSSGVTGSMLFVIEWGGVL